MPRRVRRTQSDLLRQQGGFTYMVKHLHWLMRRYSDVLGDDLPESLQLVRNIDKETDLIEFADIRFAQGEGVDESERQADSQAKYKPWGHAGQNEIFVQDWDKGCGLIEYLLSKHDEVRAMDRPQLLADCRSWLAHLVLVRPEMSAEMKRLLYGLQVQLRLLPLNYDSVCLIYDMFKAAHTVLQADGEDAAKQASIRELQLQLLNNPDVDMTVRRKMLFEQVWYLLHQPAVPITDASVRAVLAAVLDGVDADVMPEAEQQQLVAAIIRRERRVGQLYQRERARICLAGSNPDALEPIDCMVGRVQNDGAFYGDIAENFGHSRDLSEAGHDDERGQVDEALCGGDKITLACLRKAFNQTALLPSGLMVSGAGMVTEDGKFIQSFERGANRTSTRNLYVRHHGGQLFVDVETRYRVVCSIQGGEQVPYAINAAATVRYQLQGVHLVAVGLEFSGPDKELLEAVWSHPENEAFDVAAWQRRGFLRAISDTEVKACLGAAAHHKRFLGIDDPNRIDSPVKSDLVELEALAIEVEKIRDKITGDNRQESLLAISNLETRMRHLLVGLLQRGTLQQRVQWFMQLKQRSLQHSDPLHQLHLGIGSGSYTTSGMATSQMWHLYESSLAQQCQGTEFAHLFDTKTRWIAKAKPTKRDCRAAAKRFAKKSVAKIKADRLFSWQVQMLPENVAKDGSDWGEAMAERLLRWGNYHISEHANTSWWQRFWHQVGWESETGKEARVAKEEDLLVERLNDMAIDDNLMTAMEKFVAQHVNNERLQTLSRAMHQVREQRKVSISVEEGESIKVISPLPGFNMDRFADALSAYLAGSLQADDFGKHLDAVASYANYFVAGTRDERVTVESVMAMMVAKVPQALGSKESIREKLAQCSGAKILHDLIIRQCSIPQPEADEAKADDDAADFYDGKKQEVLEKARQADLTDANKRRELYAMLMEKPDEAEQNGWQEFVHNILIESMAPDSPLSCLWTCSSASRYHFGGQKVSRTFYQLCQQYGLEEATSFQSFSLADRAEHDRSKSVRNALGNPYKLDGTTFYALHRHGVDHDDGNALVPDAIGG